MLSGITLKRLSEIAEMRSRTNRRAYDLARPVPVEVWQAMANAVNPNGLRLGFVGPDRPDALRRHRAIASEAWRIELTTPARSWSLTRFSR